MMDGADAVMLSGETAAGNYQFKKMTQIIEAVENSPLIQSPQNTPQIKNKAFYNQNNLSSRQLWLMLSKLKLSQQ
jgi:pyruvate kinase